MTILLLTLALTNLAPQAWTAQAVAPFDQSQVNMRPNREDREKMASAHEEMAICLRSEQEISHCHAVLHEQCQAMTGGTCAGMEMEHGKHKGLKRGK